MLAPQAEDSHQQPDVNYIQVLEKVDFPRMVTLTGSPFKGNKLKAETGKIVHFWWSARCVEGLAVVPTVRRRDPYL